MSHDRSAIILCGGESKRMGRSKAFLEFEGEALLARICRIVGEVADPIIVVSAKGQAVPVLSELCALVEDDIPFSGPLAGLCRGYEALSGSGGYTFVCGCDHPFLTGPFLLGLLEKAAGEDVIALASGRPQPLCAWYRYPALTEASRLLASGEKRLSKLFDRLIVRQVETSELEGLGGEKATISVNTPDEFREAISLARSS